MTMRTQEHRLVRGLCSVFTLLLLISGSSSDNHDVMGMGHHDDPPKMFDKSEMGEKIKELLSERPERPDGLDFDLDFETLFDQLDGLAAGMPDDFKFDLQQYGPPQGHPVHGRSQALKCLNNANQFSKFLHKVHQVMDELHQEYLDDINDSMDTDDTTMETDSNDNSNSTELDSDDSRSNNSSDVDTIDTTDSQDDTTDMPDMRSQDMDVDIEDPLRKKRDMAREGFDLDEILDRLESDDIECLAGFVSEGDEKFLCRRFSTRSSGIFAKIMAAGADCDDYLLEDDDDLDESHQMALLNRFKNRESGEWTDDDVKKVLRLAPDVIDDDFLEDLPENLFKQNMRLLGRMATSRGGNPRLRYALRQKLDDMDLDSMTLEDIRELGPALLSLRLDQIETLNGSLLLDADIDDIFDSKESDESGSSEEDDDDDDDDEDDEVDDVRMAIGRRMKLTIQGGNMRLNRQQMGRALRFLHDDLDFVRSIDPEDLFEAMEDIRDVDYDDDDVKSVFYQMSRSSRFPAPQNMTAQNLAGMGRLLRGMGVSELASVRKEAFKDALDQIKDIDFDENQAEEILEDLLEDVDMETYQATDLRGLGKLMRGMPTAHLQNIKDDVIEDVLDELDDLDLSDVQKRVIAAKTRHNDNLVSAKLLQLKAFAPVISVDDLDDFDETTIRLHMNVTSKIPWRLPQAAVLAQMYKKANGAKRLRPSHLAQMGQIARGLLPFDLRDMADTQDDVLDLAEELKDMQEELTSGQIDELVERFNEVSDLDNKEVVIDESHAMQGAHILAYVKPEQFGKLEFTRAGKMAFVLQVAKMSSHKMARDHVQFLARKMLDMIEDMDTADSKEENPGDRESRRLRSLGQMTLGLTPSQIRGFSGKAVIDNLDILRTLPMTKAQANAVLERVDDGAENWRCRSDVLVRVGPLLQHHDNPFSGDCEFTYKKELTASLSAMMKGLEKRREIVKERIEEGFGRENDDATDDDGEKRLVQAMVLSATQTLMTNVRRRRAISQAGELTCDIVTRLRSSANQVELDLLTSMKEEEFKNCLPTLGSISDWPQQSLDALTSKAKMVYKGVENWTNEIIRRAGVIVAGLSPAEIQQLKVTGVDALNSVGKHRRLRPEQLKAGFRRWLTQSGKTDVTQITDGEFSSLSEFVCGLEISDIKSLNANTFKRSLDVIGDAMSCTPEQRMEYVQKAVAVYGSDISKWEPAVVADMGHLISYLGSDQIRALTSSHLALLSPKIITSMTTDAIAAMTQAQLMAMSSNQANAVTQAQYDALSSQQKSVLDTKAVIAFVKSDGSVPGGDGKPNGENGAGQVAVSAVLTFSAAVLASLFL